MGWKDRSRTRCKPGLGQQQLSFVLMMKKESLDGWTDGWSKERMEGGKKGWMEGRTDGRCSISKCRSLVLHK